MAEEFIDDIIAAAETEDKASDNNDVNIDTETNVEDLKIDENKNSSTPDESTQTNDDISDLDDTDVAPPESSEVEELASKLGWNKEHSGAEKVDAATYILRSKDIQKTMKDHNKDLKNQLNGLQGSVEALKNHNERVYQADVKKLQAELTILRKEKKAAVELADVEKVEEIDKQIDDVKSTIDTPIKKENTVVNPVYDEWVADNEWYLTDKEMAAYADTIADQYEGAPPERIFALVKQKVAEVFPDKFEVKKPTENKVTENKVTEPEKKVIGPQSPVEKGARTGDSNNFSKTDLTDEQKMIMNQFVKGGIMTEKQYIADIAKMQGA